MPQSWSMSIGQAPPWQLPPAPRPAGSQHTSPGRHAADVVHATPESRSIGPPPPDPKEPPNELLAFVELQDTSATATAAAAAPAITGAAARCICPLPFLGHPTRCCEPRTAESCSLGRSIVVLAPMLVRGGAVRKTRVIATISIRWG